jgi:hypothetical protein
MAALLAQAWTSMLLQDLTPLFKSKRPSRMASWENQLNLLDRHFCPAIPGSDCLFTIASFVIAAKMRHFVMQLATLVRAMYVTVRHICFQVM